MSEVVIIYPSTGLDKKGTSIGLPLSALHAVTLVARKYKTRIIDQRIQKNWKELLKEEIKTHPICVGISAMTGYQIRGGVEASKLVKTMSRETPVVWGGVHASLLPYQTLENKNVDIVVVNEGETRFLHLVDRLKNQEGLARLEGVGFKKDGKIIITPCRGFEDLSKLPDIPYHLLNVGDYFLNLYQSRKTLSLQTGRGCPHRCMYCYNLAYHKRKYRTFTVNQIVSRIKKCKEFGARSIDLVDDNFFVIKKKAGMLCKRLQRDKINVKFMTNIRMDYIVRYSLKELKTLKKCGFNELFIGIESGSDTTLKNIKKDITVNQIMEGNKKLKKSGIKAIYSFMGGFPEETKEELVETVDIMLKLLHENQNISLTGLKIFTPYPGSELFDVCVKSGFTPPSRLEEWSSFNYNTAKYGWGSKADTKFLEKLSFLTLFIDEKTAIHHLSANSLLKPLIRLYCKIARFRCKHHFYFLTPEIGMFKLLYKTMF